MLNSRCLRYEGELLRPELNLSLGFRGSRILVVLKNGRLFKLHGDLTAIDGVKHQVSSPPCGCLRDLLGRRDNESSSISLYPYSWLHLCNFTRLKHPE